MKTAIGIGLRSIPPANRRQANLARVARHGKPSRAARQDTASTSFKPRVILPDPRTQAARGALQKALSNRARDLEELIADAADVTEAVVWRGLLKNLIG